MADTGSSLTGMNREMVMMLGLRACGALSEGSTAVKVRGVLTAKGLTPAQASRVMLSAVSALCPEYKDKVNP